MFENFDHKVQKKMSFFCQKITFFVKIFKNRPYSKQKQKQKQTQKTKNKNKNKKKKKKEKPLLDFCLNMFFKQFQHFKLCFLLSKNFVSKKVIFFWQFSKKKKKKKKKVICSKN